ncbi:MAG: VCBS repeat-containing protein [Planctomycetes bacterium]|nr:VCBS repeat-containing protein [Planctomycetota bacterium]
MNELRPPPARRSWVVPSVLAVGLLPLLFFLWGSRLATPRLPGPGERVRPSTAVPEASSEARQGAEPAAEVRSAKVESFLTDEDQKRIWDIEHEAYLLSEKSFVHFRRCLKGEVEDSGEALDRLFSPEFDGAAIEFPALAADPDFPYLLAGSAAAPAASPKPVDAAGMVRYLKTLIGLFEVSPALSCKIKSLKHQAREDGSGEWSVMRLKMVAKGRHRDFGFLKVTWYQDLTALPVSDEDPSPTAWIRSWQVRSVSAQASARLLFREVTGESGLNAFRYHDNWTAQRPEGVPKPDISGGVYLADYNRDGRLDVLVTDLYGCFLFRGAEGARFEPDTDFGHAQAEMSALWADLDNDGWVDLVLGTQIYWNREGKLAASGKRFPTSRYTRDPQWSVGDFDGDGRLDLYGLNQGRVSPLLLQKGTRGFIDQNLESYIENVLWRNLGNGEFEDVTSRAGASGKFGKSFAALWLHADQDLHPEIFVVNEFGRNAFLANNGDGTFTLQNADPGWGGFSMGVCSGDVNNDGRTDIYIANMYSSAGKRILEHVPFERYPESLREPMRHIVDGNSLYLATGDHQYTDEGVALDVHEVGWAYSGAMLDMNNDGFLDLYAPAGHHSVTGKAPDG